MKIVELRAENVKRLRAVEIRPDGALQVIGGRNAQGKSSVLDAIWLALGGGKASKETRLPIRDGEKKASVHLDLGELVVTRSWTRNGTSLKVTNADGAPIKSPQSVLDSLLAGVSFDPLAFIRLSPARQREALLDLVELDVDFDALADQRRAAYEARTDIGRQIRALGASVVDEAIPEAEESIAAIAEEIEKARKINSDREASERAIASYRGDIRELQETILNLRMEIENAEDQIRITEAALEDTQAELDELPVACDIAAITERLRGVEERNARIRENNRARQIREEKRRLEKTREEYTAKIEKIDAEKNDALERAIFPIDGLGFDEDGVTYAGIPFSQASSAEQIRIATAMAMAANPRLRVAMIRDGSLLDDETLKGLRQQVTDAGFQLWIERVGDGDAGAVIIEDGEVAS
jgi:DNA repair exonuclease SbcCD ATPase subunit